MNLSVPHRQNPLLSPSPFLLQTTPNPILLKPRIFRKKRSFRVCSSANPNGSDGFSWPSLTRAFRLGSERFLLKLRQSVKKETGFDLEGANVKLGEFVERIKGQAKMGEAELTRLKTDFIDWNRLDRWKDFKNWQPKRVGVLVLYVFVMMFSCQRMYVAIRAPFLDRERRQLTEAYMEALIPEPSPINVRKFKKNMWRKVMPKGLKMKKFVEGPNGTLIRDTSYVGEDAWDDDPVAPLENVKQIIENDMRLNKNQKKELKEDLGISGEVQKSQGTWRERLQTWKEILREDKLAEQLDASNSKYAVEFDMKEVENSLRKDVVEKVTDTQGTRALWISKRWWHYRPKFPYTYFLQKLDCSEVAAVVFTEDLKRLYVTMKEGFPLEYVVDIPLDPYLFEAISSAAVEVDLLQKRQIHYFLKVVIALLPGLLILWLIRESVMLLHITSNRFLYKKYNQLFDMAYAENFILPVGDVGETKSMYKEVVLGGDVWDLLDEIMIYMGNPMQYYERGVKFVRGVLLSGPPGTGKTLFARTLAKESGLPFVFASGAEFTDSEKSGAARINEMFSIARRNAPCFVFVDEIDAIAGRHARKDPRRRATFEALIAQLDGEKDKTGVDRFSLRQAVIFICATNRPDELDLEFVRPGRIDRRLYIGLPDANQRVQIFGVHSAGKQLAEDVDFRKLVFRTVGFSGADIRNLVNEAAIMSVRKGRSKINQEDIVDVLDKQLLEGMGVLLTEEEQQKCEESVSFEKKRLLAVHEAGHILLAHLFPHFDWHAFSQLLPGGKETAISVFYPREDMIDQGYTTFGYMKMQMVVTHGGRCAERLVFGDDITDGGSDDLEKITKIAREMVISPQNARLGLTSLTKRVGLMDRPDSSDGGLIKYRWDDPHVIPSNMTLEVSELFTRELTRYIEETEELAMIGLRDNMHILDVLAKELLDKSRITGLEVEEIMKGLSPTMFEDFVKPFQINIDEEGPLPHNDKLRYQPLDIYPAPLHRS
ncbi:Cell division protein ftsH, putative [Ricinus communis]|uniref:Cell division protein ftsH, putative n=1 Tax=Ricinus communis TaxID=3988 RepID=B9RHY7_RICCO|nr:Cell division protein ftsH, putative [Ricinus communis]|eukprot:XP_002513356.1 ATP-dependent zinc metalloprotease FTSH 12, chloroplastic isoform X1 [Ricinus communis]